MMTMMITIKFLPYYTVQECISIYSTVRYEVTVLTRSIINTFVDNILGTSYISCVNLATNLATDTIPIISVINLQMQSHSYDPNRVCQFVRSSIRSPITMRRSSY